jgi:hypothetical protein
MKAGLDFMADAQERPAPVGPIGACNQATFRGILSALWVLDRRAEWGGDLWLF